LLDADPPAVSFGYEGVQIVEEFLASEVFQGEEFKEAKLIVFFRVGKCPMGWKWPIGPQSIFKDVLTKFSRRDLADHAGEKKPLFFRLHFDLDMQDIIDIELASSSLVRMQGGPKQISKFTRNLFKSIHMPSLLFFFVFLSAALVVLFFFFFFRFFFDPVVEVFDRIDEGGEDILSVLLRLE